MRSFYRILLVTAVVHSFLLPQSRSTIKFDGVDDFAELGDWFRFQTFTIEMWVNAGSTQNTFADIIDNKHTGGSSWVVQQDWGNVNSYAWGVADGAPVALMFTIPADHWVHLAFVRDSITRAHYLYVNGVLKDSTVGTQDIYYNGTEILRFANWGEGGRIWNGKMDNVRIWNTVRSQAQIVNGMYTPVTGVESGLVSGWNFSETNGTTASDVTGAHHAQLMNGPLFVTDSLELSDGKYLNAGLLAEFTTQTGNSTFSAERFNSVPAGTQPAGVTTLHQKYWRIFSTTTGTLTANMTFSLGAHALTYADQEHPGRIKLFYRAAGSTGAWSLVDSADKASFGSVTFTGISTFGEFAIGTTSTSPLNGVTGVFISAATGNWSSASSWLQLEPNDEDGIPDINDDIVIRAGHTITGENVYCNNMVLEGANVGTRLNIIGSYVGVNGTVNTDQTTLSSNLITTGSGGYLSIIGEPRVLFGNNWSGDVQGWKVYFSLNQFNSTPSLILTDFKAGEIDLHSGFVQIGTWEEPKNLYLDMGSDNTGTFVSTPAWWFWAGFTVTGNISRTPLLSSKCNAFTLDGGFFEIGGGTISADNITLGSLNRAGDSHALVKIRSNTGLHFNTSNYICTNTEIEYRGTALQTSGDEMSSGLTEAITVNNPYGVELLTVPAQFSKLTLTSGDISAPGGMTLNVRTVIGDTNSVKGDCNVLLHERFSTAHPGGLDSLFQHTGTFSHPGGTNLTADFTGTVPQVTGERMHADVNFIHLMNPAGVTLSNSVNLNSLWLENGGITVNFGDTIWTVNCDPVNNAVGGTGTFIMTSTSPVLSNAPNGLDDTYPVANVRFENAPFRHFKFRGTNQSTGLKLPDTVGSIEGTNLTLSKSVTTASTFMQSHLRGTYTIPAGMTLRTKSFHSETNGDKIVGAGNIIFEKGLEFRTSHPDGVNGNIQVTGSVTFPDSSYFFIDGPTKRTGSLFPDSVWNLTLYLDSVIVDKPFTVRNKLALQRATLDNTAHNITMANGSMIHQWEGKILSMPLFSGQYDVSYENTSGPTGAEIPDAPSVLRNLSGSGSTFALNKHTTVNGLVNIASVSADTFRFTVNGSINEGGLYTGSSYGPIFSGLLDRMVNNTSVIQYRLNSPIAQHFSTNIELLSLSDSGHIAVAVRDTSLHRLPAFPTGYNFVKNYYQMEQRGIDSLSANIHLEYPADLVKHGIPDADSLHVLQWKGNAWHEVPVLGKDLTFARNIVAGPVDTLTTFVIAGPQRKGTAVLSTHALSYGTVKTGTEKLDSVTIMNTGQYALTLTSPRTAKGDTVFRILDTIVVIPTGESAVLRIRFSSPTVGTKNDTLIIVNNGMTGADTVVLHAVSADGKFALSRPAVFFGDIPAESSVKDSVYIKNIGTFLLTVRNMYTQSLSFTFSPDSLSILPGDSEKVVITFASGPAGVKRDTIAMATDIYNTPSYYLPLSGNSIASRFALHPIQLNFGTLLRGLSSKDSILVKNPGGTILSIDSIRSGRNSYSILPAARTIGAGDSAWFTVTFAPQSSGDLNSALVFYHSAFTSPDTLIVNGTGIEPIFSNNRTSIIFGNSTVGDPKQDSMIVTNSGTSPLSITSVISSDTNQFKVFPLSAMIAPSASKTFIVTFLPASMGVQNATLVMNHNAVNAKDSLELSGFGIMPFFTASTRLLSMGEVRVDSSRTDSIEITNTGNTTLAMTNVTSSDSQFVIFPTAVNLAPNAKKAFAITFTPKSRYLKQTKFLFTYNGKSSPDTVGVTGVGIEPDFAAAPLRDFFKVRVGRTKAETLFVHNSGNMPLTIFSDTTRTEKFTITPNSAVVPKDGSYPFIISFTSLQRGPFADTVIFHHDHYTGTPDTVLLKALAVEPLFVPRFTHFNFDSVRVHTQKQDSVWIRNPGNMDLTITGITSTDSTLKMLPAAAVIPEGDSLKFKVTFAPHLRNTYSTKFEFTHDADSNPDTLSAEGVGVEPLFIASRTLVNFGDVRTDSTRRDSIRIANPGNMRLTVHSVNGAHLPFIVSSLPSSIGIGDSTFLSLTFAPKEPGSYVDTIVIHHNAEKPADTVIIQGISTTPIFAALKKSLNFGTVLKGKSRTDSVYIKNIGSAPLKIASLSVTDTSYQISATAAMIAPSESLSFIITLKPFSSGNRNASLVFVHDARSHQDTVQLFGRSLQPVTIAAARSMPESSDVVVIGIVTRSKGAFTYLQDSTGAIAVRQTSGAFFDSVASTGIRSKDRVQLYGRVTQFNQLKQINQGSLISFERIMRNDSLPKAQEVTLKQIATAGEQYESELITVKNGSFSAVTDTVFLPAKSYSVTDPSDSTLSVVFRIGNAADTDLDGKRLPKKTFNFTGVLSQFHASDSSKGYQLMPILTTDLESDPTGVTDEQNAAVPLTYVLYNNYPNPFNPSTTIRFGVPEASSVRIEIYDILGRRVEELFNGTMEAGYRNVVWNASVATGMYLYRIESRSLSNPEKKFSSVKKMLLMK